MPCKHPFATAINALSLNPSIWKKPSTTYFGGEVIEDDCYAINGRSDEYDHYWQHATENQDQLVQIAISSCGSYKAFYSNTFEPHTTFIFHNDNPIAFYSAGMLWVDEEHRRKRLGVSLIILTCEHIKANPLRQTRLAPDDDDGETNEDYPMGFSFEGYLTHKKAYQTAKRLLSQASRKSPPQHPL